MAIPKQHDGFFDPPAALSPSPALHFALERPKSLSPAQLDGYLASGWYRQGQGLFTTYSTISRKIMMAAPWIRVETGRYSLSKNLRRLKSKNDSRITYHIGKAVVTPYREDMFQRFRRHFKGEFYESLHSALFCYQTQPGSIFDSWEVTFYLDGSLIGYSYFDVGENSVASILNIYAHESIKHSLGMYSIILQLQWARDNGKKYYYPGYAMPENPRFGYKLRIRGVDYLDQISSQWFPWEKFQLNRCPLYQYREAMVKAKEVLRPLGWGLGVYLNHSNPCPLLMDRGASFLSHPIFLSGDITEDPHPVIVDYDLVDKAYRLFQATAHYRHPFPDHRHAIEDVVFPVEFDVVDYGCVALLTLDDLICKTDNLSELYQKIMKCKFSGWTPDNLIF